MLYDGLIKEALMTHTIPRLLVAAPNSGSGKTTVVCALLQALKKRGLSLTAFKSGPDYIDPMFHRRVLDTPSYNLDLFLFGRGDKGAEAARHLLVRHGKGADLVLIEGAMGYYDGVGTGHEASAYDVAAATDTPVVIVVDGRGAGLSLGAVLKGMADFYKDSRVAGFIVNRIKPMVYAHFKAAWETASGLKALGTFPDMPDCAFSSRHLGLVTAGEIRDLQAIMERLSEMAEKHIDLDGLLTLAEAAPLLDEGDVRKGSGEEANVRIAIARDEAFCFYYEDSLDVLRRFGAELIFFSPLHDEALPPCDGLYLGGGYPELYAKALEDNGGMRRRIGQALKGGLPCFAECGGFMYLHQYFRGDDGQRYAWVGAVPGETFMTTSLQHFGYVTLKAEEDNLLGKAGDTIPAHEFHYSKSTLEGEAFTAYKAGSSRSWFGGIAGETLAASYLHLHFLGNPAWAKHFVRACRAYSQREHIDKSRKD